MGGKDGEREEWREGVKEERVLVYKVRSNSTLSL